MTLHEGESLLTDDIKALVGKPWPEVVYEVDRTGIRAWARAVGYDDPIYYDESVALARGYPRLPAPPGFLGVPRFRPGDPEPGPPIRGLHPKLQRSVNGGTELHYDATIFAGDELVATPVIVDIKERNGSLGQMLIFTREVRFKRQSDLVATLRATVINYRGDDSG
jgi:N-terminal half of MaoC dehydratase